LVNILVVSNFDLTNFLCYVLALTSALFLCRSVCVRKSCAIFGAEVVAAGAAHAAASAHSLSFRYNKVVMEFHGCVFALGSYEFHYI